MGTGPYTPGNGALVYNWTHGRDERQQQSPRHQVVEPFAKRGGKQSMGGRTWPHSVSQTGMSPHVSPSNVPDRLRPNLSISRTIRPDNATTEPSPDVHWSCARPTLTRSSPCRQGKNPGHCGETPISGPWRLIVLKTALGQRRRKAVMSDGET